MESVYGRHRDLSLNQRKRMPLTFRWFPFKVGFREPFYWYFSIYYIHTEEQIDDVGIELAEAGSTLSRARFVHPRVEPEIAFLIKQPLVGRVDPMTAMAAVAGVAPALEVIDSRYENFRFSVTDVVADNTSAAAIVVGPWSSPSTDIANLGMLLEIDRAPRHIGSTAAILAHPLYALVAAEGISVNQFIKLSVEKLGSVSFAMGH